MKVLKLQGCLGAEVNTLVGHGGACGTWWRLGWDDDFQPEGRGFDSCSSRHVGTLGKSLCHSVGGPVTLGSGSRICKENNKKASLLWNSITPNADSGILCWDF